MHGKFLLTASGSGTGVRRIQFWKNGVSLGTSVSTPGSATQAVGGTGVDVHVLAEGDYIEANVWHDAGANRDTVGNYSFGMQFLGPS
jgi:hypothetical protein